MILKSLELKVMRSLGIAGVVVGLLFGAAVPAQASTVEYAFQFSGNGFSGSGDIFVNSQLIAGGYDITNITGSIQGPSSSSTGAIISLDTQPGTPNATGLWTDSSTGKQWLYNDVFYPGKIPFDNNGILFSFGNNDIGNIYSIGTQLYLSVSNPASDFDPGAPIAFTVAAAPIPAALPMFLTALGGLWLLLRRRTKDTSSLFKLEHTAAA
jgi:hypothetical protein